MKRSNPHGDRPLNASRLSALVVASAFLASCGQKPVSPQAPPPTATVQVSPVVNLASLPSLPDGSPARAAAVFGPAGAKFPEGVLVTWPLAEPREPGTR